MPTTLQTSPLQGACLFVRRGCCAAECSSCLVLLSTDRAHAHAESGSEAGGGVASRGALLCAGGREHEGHEGVEQAPSQG